MTVRFFPEGVVLGRQSNCSDKATAPETISVLYQFKNTLARTTANCSFVSRIRSQSVVESNFVELLRALAKKF